MPRRLSAHLLLLHLANSQEQGKKSRVKGVEAVKASILAAKTVARTCRSSLGPKGMDKMLQGPDGDVTISEWRSFGHGSFNILHS